MNISTKLLAKLQEEIDAAHNLQDTLLQEERTFAHVASKPVIERIPGVLARAILEKQKSVTVCEIAEFAAAVTTPLFAGERLFYLPSGGSHHFGYDDDVRPEGLFGASRQVYDYCCENGLSPMLWPAPAKKIDIGTARASWNVCTLQISWNLATLGSMLKLKNFKSRHDFAAG